MINFFSSFLIFKLPMKSVFLCLVLVVACLADYQIGTGIADITAGPAGHNFMGYAQMTQRTEGIF